MRNEWAFTRIVQTWSYFAPPGSLAWIPAFFLRLPFFFGSFFLGKQKERAYEFSILNQFSIRSIPTSRDSGQVRPSIRRRSLRTTRTDLFFHTVFLSANSSLSASFFYFPLTSLGQALLSSTALRMKFVGDFRAVSGINIVIAPAVTRCTGK